jgi:hypothetical protein
MAGKIIMWCVTFLCALLFFLIGVYSRRRKTPMWFYSGTEVDASKITDVKKYNSENGAMWQLYSLWYLAAGIAEIWSTIIATVILVLGGTVGIAILVTSYERIYKKYSAN